MELVCFLLRHFDPIGTFCIVLESVRRHAVDQSEVHRLCQLPVCLLHILELLPRHQSCSHSMEIPPRRVGLRHCLVTRNIRSNPQLYLRKVRYGEFVALLRDEARPEFSVSGNLLEVRGVAGEASRLGSVLIEVGVDAPGLFVDVLRELLSEGRDRFRDLPVLSESLHCRILLCEFAESPIICVADQPSAFWVGHTQSTKKLKNLWLGVQVDLLVF
mmetsp:Transcript_47365/g.93426  ORF Transcript_47365/g.93426 Transcript_47365/m.93426 type:complete len:216 (-) Transcript_47365:118-765(-)